MFTDAQVQHLRAIVAVEEHDVEELGDRIGYGRVMQLASQIWGKKPIAEGGSGCEHTVGPCAALTVPCGCGGGCDWCEGSGWLTKKVKAIKDAEAATKEAFVIEKLWVNPMENHPQAASGYEPCGVVLSQEQAQSLVASAGVRQGGSWPFGNEDTPEMRFKKLPVM